MQIRQATEADIDAIALIHVEAGNRLAQLAPEGLGTVMKEGLVADEARTLFRERLEDSDCLLLVAETEERISAVLSAAIENYPDDLLDSPYMTIEFIETSEEFQGRGAATLLIQEVESIARGKGIRNLDLSVWHGNDRARELYDRLGFAPLEIRMYKLLD